MILVGRYQAGLSTELRHSGQRKPASSPGRRARSRRFAPTVALLEDRTLLSALTITTVAGIYNNNGDSGDGKLATAAAVGTPISIAVDAAGDLFICDPQNTVVREVNATTHDITTVAGNGTAGFSGDEGPANQAELNTPYGIAVDAAGNLYIADKGNNRVREVSAAAPHDITTVAGNGTSGSSGNGGLATQAELDAPHGIAVDSYGNIFIADYGNNVVREVNAVTHDISIYAGNGTGYYSGDGGPATAATLDEPFGLAVDAAGNLYIADSGNAVIREVSAAAPHDISTVAGNGDYGYGGDGGPAIDAVLYSPDGVTVDAAGDIFIADTGNNVIREVSAAAPHDISTVAGNAPYGGYRGDGGPPTAAWLYGPADVAVNAAGNLYIADFGNNVIREVAPAAPPVSPPATVQSISVQTIKIRKKPTKVIVLQFSEALNQADAQNKGAYSLVTVPKTKKQKSKPVAIAKASYNQFKFTVTLYTSKPLVLNPPLRLTITAARLLDALGRPLDGNDSGQSGANYVATLR